MGKTKKLSDDFMVCTWRYTNRLGIQDGRHVIAVCHVASGIFESFMTKRGTRGIDQALDEQPGCDAVCKKIKALMAQMSRQVTIRKLRGEKFPEVTEARIKELSRRVRL
jgi:hypothetical protein